jgi:hypothetical protein
MSLYACQEFAPDGVTCQAWATVHPYLLPPLSAAEAVELSGLIVGAWILAVCGRYLVHRFQRS